jgi:hypothetical protein
MDVKFSYMPPNGLLPVILSLIIFFCVPYILIIYLHIAGASLHFCCNDHDLSLRYFLFVLSVLLFEDTITDSFPFAGKILDYHAFGFFFKTHATSRVGSFKFIHSCEDVKVVIWKPLVWFISVDILDVVYFIRFCKFVNGFSYGLYKAYRLAHK